MIFAETMLSKISHSQHSRIPRHSEESSSLNRLNLREEDRRRKIPPPPCKFPQYSWTVVIVERLIRKRGDRRVCSSARIRDTDTELLFSSQRGEGNVNRGPRQKGR